jgi:hypothetical protein
MAHKHEMNNPDTFDDLISHVALPISVAGVGKGTGEYIILLTCTRCITLLCPIISFPALRFPFP